MTTFDWMLSYNVAKRDIFTLAAGNDVCLFFSPPWLCAKCNGWSPLSKLIERRRVEGEKDL